VNNGSQPTQPTATNCWDDYQFNITSCSWVNNGTQPTQPTATNCWDNYQFNTTSCTWVNNGTQPTQPTATNCWDDYQFNTTSCSWLNNGSQPTQPTATNCWDDYQFNTTSCSWLNNGSQPTQPTATNCWDNYQFNTTSCTWVNNGSQPIQPMATNCWDDYQFNTTSCTWVNNGTQPTQPTATNCWDNYQFNTTSCTWVNNGSQPAQPTATNCWDDYQFNTTSCSWVNNGSQPTQPTATNCWDNYQFNTTSCTWVNNGTQPAQPTVTNCWDDYQFNTTSCSWVNNGSQPTQPTATNCWDDYQFNTTSCTWVNNGTQPTQPTLACYQTASFNTTSCSWDVIGIQQPSPLITVNNPVCNGSTYSVEFNSNGTIVASSGTINGNTVNGIAVGTDLTLTATSSNGCATSSISIISPTNCVTPRGCVNPILSAGQGTCSGTGTYSFAFNVSQNADISASAGTVSGNTVINIPIGTTVILTAIDGLCSTSIQVNSPLDCSTPCGSPLASFSAGICNGDTYSISISNPNGAIITSSLGTITTTAITGIPTGASVTVTSSLSGCISQQITILSPIKIAPMLVVSNPICNGNSYSVTYSSNGSIDISSGSLGSESITGIPVGTDLLIIASSLNGCASTTMTVKSPLNCANPPTDCVMPTLSAGQGTCAGTGTYSFAFNASVGAVVSISSGTISGNEVTGIALGTNVTLTATNGSCVTSLVVNSPIDCSTPCATPVVSFSAGICNGTTYSINISNPNNATITTSAGIVTATAITGIPIGTSVTITSSISGCSSQIITISSPLIPVNPNAGNDGSIEICDGDVPTNSELFAALGGNPQLGGSWSNSGNIYTYTVMAASSCASLPLDRATVTVSTIFINDFEVIGHCNDSRYQLTINPVQSDAVYSWYNGIGDLLGTGNSMYINDSDTYEVTSSKSICSKVKSIYIENTHCIIPQGVSPNGDGLNDTWDLSNMNVEKAQIFNRYGMEMYSKSNYVDEWHGQTDEGQMLPSATYYYVLRFLDGTSKTGWVYLNREQ
jgi:gliding motility-associated-like protein